MDDPLRPKAIPLAAETVLWFEFLLDPNLLTKHLNKPNAEPTPIDLINQFIAMSPEMQQITQIDLVGEPTDILRGIPVTPGTGTIIPTGDAFRLTRKQFALKILTLKVATFLRWDLDLFEKNLTNIRQISLLRDLCTICFGKPVPIPIPPDFNTTVASEGNEKAAKFALTIYHRWVLRLQIIKDIANKALRPQLHNNFHPIEPMNPNFGADIPTEPSIEFLKQLCQASEPFYVCTNDTFVLIHPNSETNSQNFEAMKLISPAELRTQIFFDFVNFYLYTKQYRKAQEAVIECRKSLLEMKSEYNRRPKEEFIFCHLDEGELEGYLMACGVSEGLVSLMEKFSTSILNNYKDIIEILKADNKFHEIPIVNRRILELDLEGAISLGVLKESRELEMKVAALNVVRCIFEEGNIFSSVDFFDKYKNFNCFAALADGIFDVQNHCSLRDRNKIKEFLVDCILKHPNGKNLLQIVEPIGIFSNLEVEDLKRQITEEEIFVPLLATQTDWKITARSRVDPAAVDRIEVGSLERQLISCTNANAVRKLLVKLAATNPTKPLFTVNPSWQIPTPINSLLMSMQRGFLQDFAYVLLGKAREMSAKNDYVGAVSMLSVLKSETQRQELSTTSSVSKLGKLVNWEILLIQICQCLEEWNKKTLDLQSLGNRCKQCLSSLQSGDNIIPRIEIIDHCTIMLLNLSEWQALSFLDKRLPQLELPLAFATTFLDMEKMKGTKKACRDAWDIVLPLFSNQTKRGGGGNSRNSPSLAINTGLQSFLKRIRDQGLFSLVISLLGKIHNILKDDANYELNGEYIQLWPTSISNPLGYNIRSVSETLNWLLKEALKYYPQAITWLKMKGDIEMAIGNNEAAMRCYVNALITGTEYCTIPLQRMVADDFVIRKMIRCCSNLGCYMQAAILCQFLEEVDYSLAFKNLTEKSSNFNDAMDAYYGCIWDTTLLEFIVNLHAKKGENTRKLEAIAIMSTLELNANNNDEIKREAAAIRKSKFLRALAKQYLI